MTNGISFSMFFANATGWATPHAWQERLGRSTEPGNRLIRVPTGCGKTAGAVLVWAYHRLVRNDSRWPRRLVYCLPMRTLVEQTRNEIEFWISALEPTWGTHGTERPGVHVLMGGVSDGDWALAPERPAILIGTQDMLLSRALNRGYGAARARWPMEFGLLIEAAAREALREACDLHSAPSSARPH